MNELNADPNKPKQLKTRPGAQSSDVAALSGLLDFMNNSEITGAVIPAGEDPKEALRAKPIAAAAAPTIPEFSDPLANIEIPDSPQDFVPPVPPPPVVAAPTAPPNRLFFTGNLGVGKDYLANAAGLKVFGVADPLYAIAEYFFGVTINSAEGKGLHGARAFLQAVGQIGRGVISEQYPLTPARANLIEVCRRLGAAGEFGGRHGVDWESFGRNNNIWLDAGVCRVDFHLAEHPDARVAITNVRFDHEFKALQSAGWAHFHVMLGSKTWIMRLAKLGLTPDSPQLKDVSERLASNFNAGVVKQLSAQKQGPMLRVVWCDENSAPPWPRVHTVQSFLKHVGVAAQHVAAIINDEF